jgi:hypothetical protein
MNYGKEIFNQLKVTTPMPVIWSWGASSFKTFEAEQIGDLGHYYLGGLCFYVRGAKFKGHVIVSLAGNDTYTITLGHLANRKIRVKKQIEGAYCDNFSEIIDNLIESN